MQPIYQTIKHGNGQVGNCFQAAVASLLELNLEDVPHFFAKNNHLMDFYAWLAQRGLCAVEFTGMELDGRADYWGYHLISGPSPRHPDIRHCVVGLSGDIVHDPYPDSGLPIEQSLPHPRRDWKYTFIVPLVVTVNPNVTFSSALDQDQFERHRNLVERRIS